MLRYMRPGTRNNEQLFNFACRTVASICATLARFQKQRVALRLINADSIRFRFSEREQTYKFSKLVCFDFAIVLKKKNCQVKQ